MSTNMEQASAGDKPPYPPQTAALGGSPSIEVDVPICAVFIALYLSCAVTNIVIFQTNLRRGHKFLIQGLMVGFCMARVLTCVLRIAWATRLGDVSLGIAATLFNNLGVFLLYIIDLLFAQRILRARRPTIGWHSILKVALTIAYSLVAVVAILVITFTVLGYYTRDSSLLTAVRDVQLAASTYILVFATLPYLLIAVAYLSPQAGNALTETFGRASLEYKTVILLILTSVILLAQGFKYGIAWLPARPMSDSPWYDSKACFFCFGFMLEIIWMILALSVRVDKTFHVPNGSSKRKSYLIFEEVKDTPSVSTA